MYPDFDSSDSKSLTRMHIFPSEHIPNNFYLLQFVILLPELEVVFEQTTIVMTASYYTFNIIFSPHLYLALNVYWLWHNFPTFTFIWITRLSGTAEVKLSKVLWICLLGYENLLNLNWYILKFHNRYHTNVHTVNTPIINAPFLLISLI